MSSIVSDKVEEGHRAYSLVAYSKSLHRKVSLVVYLLPDGSHRLFFSTDVNMSGKDVLETYRSRFQIEFCFLCGEELQ